MLQSLWFQLYTDLRNVAGLFWQDYSHLLRYILIWTNTDVRGRRRLNSSSKLLPISMIFSPTLMNEYRVKHFHTHPSGCPQASPVTFHNVTTCKKDASACPMLPQSLVSHCETLSRAARSSLGSICPETVPYSSFLSEGRKTILHCGSD